MKNGENGKDIIKKRTYLHLKKIVDNFACFLDTVELKSMLNLSCLAASACEWNLCVV